MQQLQNQPEIQAHHRHGQEEEDDDEGEEEMGDEDLKMYEQFLAANSKQQQHDLQHHNMIGHQNISGIPHLADDDSQPVEQHIDGDELDLDGEEDEDPEGEIDLDNIDYDQLDP